MGTLKITYERDPSIYGEPAEMREKQFLEILSSHGNLVVNTKSDFTLDTNLNAYMVIQYVKHVLEPDCIFKVVGYGEASELLSGKYAPATVS